jgi:DNA-binding XRE family transcriptional regulator
MARGTHSRNTGPVGRHPSPEPSQLTWMCRPVYPVFVSETTVSIHRSVDDCLGVLSITHFDTTPGTVDTLPHQFGQVVRRRRLAAGFSQEALSAAANLHRTYVGLLERGLRMPSILVAKKVAEALGTTMAELLAEVDREVVHKNRRSHRAATGETATG